MGHFKVHIRSNFNFIGEPLEDIVLGRRVRVTSVFNDIIYDLLELFICSGRVKLLFQPFLIKFYETFHPFAGDHHHYELHYLFLVFS